MSIFSLRKPRPLSLAAAAAARLRAATLRRGPGGLRTPLLAPLHRDQRGATLFFILFFVALFMGAAVIVIDFGAAFAERRVQQKNVDAMVLAGVQELTEDPALADQYARDWATRNGVDPSEIVSLVVDSSCWSDDPNDDPTLIDSISADTSRPATLFAIGELGLGSFDVGAHAKACVGSLIATDGLRPWSLSMFNSPCFQLQPGGDPTDPLEYEPIYGQECVIRLESPSSQVGSIRLGDEPGEECNEAGGGAAKYTENIIEGSGAICELGEIIDTEPGLQGNPTLKALADLLATEGACDANFDTAPGVIDIVGVDQLSEVFDPPAVVPSPDVVFTPKNCAPGPFVDGDPSTPDSPRMVTLVAIDEFDSAAGFSSTPIVAFLGFFIDRCEVLDNDDNIIGVYPKCDVSGSGGANFQIVGNFVQFMQLGGAGGAINPFGTRVTVLVE